MLLLLHIYYSCSPKCLEDQQSLLLQFKNNLTLPESSRKLKLWNKSTDCCNWSGITCDNEGHVIGLDLIGEFIYGGFNNSSSLFSLKHLQKLNLAYNYFNSPIPSGIKKLEKLTYLNLSWSRFEGQIPIEISQLTKLVTLDLSYIKYSQTTIPKIPNLQKLIQNLTNIRQLYLDDINITSSHGYEWSNALLYLPNLQVLSMSNCGLSGPLDSSLSKLENLSVIILDRNNFSSRVPQTFANFKNLTALSLAYCGLTGTFPQKIFQIGTLSFIDLSDNYKLYGSFPEFPFNGSIHTLSVSQTNFSGAFPHTIGNLRNLSKLDLSYCKLYGTLPNSMSNLTHLTYLDLTHNDLSGAIPSSLFTLPSVEMISLAFNQFVKLDINVSYSILNTLDISNNNLSSPFPTAIFQFHSLSVLSLSSNRLYGSLQLDANVDKTSCKLKTFPRFLKSLDLSDNQIHGKIPNWIWKLQDLNTLNLSHNFLSDLEGPLQNLSSNMIILDLHNNKLLGSIPLVSESVDSSNSNLVILDLHNNKLLGSIPLVSKSVEYMDFSTNNFSVVPQDIGNYLTSTSFLSLSNNNLQGSIPSSLFNASNLQVLDISVNNFSGPIPPCLITMTGTLEVLNLGNNNLTGPIPDMFPTDCVVRTLNFHGNLLGGLIPQSLSDCSFLEVFDIGSNQIVGGFPCFLQNIPTLSILVMRNNKFHGSIECSNSQENQHWKSMQIVDIAFNNFNGKLPEKYFSTWDRMIHDTDHAVSDFIHIGEVNRGNTYYDSSTTYYQDSVTVSTKRQQVKLVKILNFFTVIDFSSNHFEGPIPEVLMDFKAIHVLNLSNNALYGEIPSTIGNLKQLESLDLSNNSLVGEIPVQIASLSFLSCLNLSFNHLVGKIPTGTQLQSFEASSFEGNDGLYGSPLTEKPNSKRQDLHPQSANGIPGCSNDWSFLSAELGFVFGLGVIIGPIMFCRKWRVRYWKLVDKTLCWIFSRMYLEYATDGGQTYTVLRW